MKRIIAALSMIFVFAVSPIAAQDTTPAVDPTAAPVVVEVESPAEEATDASGGKITLNVWQLVTFAVTFFLTGGSVGVVGFGTLAKRMRNDAATMAAIEAIAKSYPPETRQLIERLGTSAVAVGELLVEAADSVPMAEKPPLTDDPLAKKFTPVG